MDREWPEEKRQRFLAVAARHPEARGIHDLRTRSSGTHDFAQFHMWIEPAMSVAAAHEVVEAIETVLEAEFPGCEVLIHLDPEGQVDHPGNALTETDETKEAIPE
jgi:ferrous-iron efflux pump FieF